MKRTILLIILMICFALAAAGIGSTVWGAKGRVSGKPPPGGEEQPDTAVGTTLVVDFTRAWRCDIDWAINPEGGVEAWEVTGFPFDELVFNHE